MDSCVFTFIWMYLSDSLCCLEEMEGVWLRSLQEREGEGAGEEEGKRRKGREREMISCGKQEDLSLTGYSQVIDDLHQGLIHRLDY